MAKLLTKLSDYTSRIRDTIGDNPSASTDRMISADATYEFMTKRAAAEFSKLWPYRRTADITAVNSQYDYPLASYCPGWAADWSWIKELEFPQGEQDPSRYRKDNFIIYNNTHIRFLTGTPGSTDTIRIIYYTPHTISASADTIPEEHEESVAMYAAGLCNMLLAQKFAKASNPSLNTDVISYRTKSDQYKSLAEFLMNEAKKSWGAGDHRAIGTRASWNWYEGDYGDYTEYRED